MWKFFLSEFQFKDYLSEFQLGLAVGLLIVLGVMLAGFIIHLALRRGRKACKMLTVPGDGGDILISVGAVRDLVESRISRFNQVQCARILIYEAEDDLPLTIEPHINFDASYGQSPSLPKVVAEIRLAVTSGLRDIFGVRQKVFVKPVVKRARISELDEDGAPASRPELREPSGERERLSDIDIEASAVSPSEPRERSGEISESQA